MAEGPFDDLEAETGTRSLKRRCKDFHFDGDAYQFDFDDSSHPNTGRIVFLMYEWHLDDAVAAGYPNPSRIACVNTLYESLTRSTLQSLPYNLCAEIIRNGDDDGSGIYRVLDTQYPAMGSCGAIRTRWTGSQFVDSLPIQFHYAKCCTQ